MKKWLAALFFSLMLAPAAWAENLLYTELCGLWRWDPASPAAALGDGVYLHVDGRCGLYDATAYDPYHTDIITGMKLREEGLWWLQGDDLVISVGKEPLTFPVEAKTAEDWAYPDGIQIGQSVYLPAACGGSSRGKCSLTEHGETVGSSPTGTTTKKQPPFSWEDGKEGVILLFSSCK